MAVDPNVGTHVDPRKQHRERAVDRDRMRSIRSASECRWKSVPALFAVRRMMRVPVIGKINEPPACIGTGRGRGVIQGELTLCEAHYTQVRIPVDPLVKVEWRKRGLA